MNKLIQTALICCIFFAASCGNAPKKEENAAEEDKKTAETVQKEEKDNPVANLHPDIAVGQWKLTAIAGKALPEGKREVTVSFDKDGNFKRQFNATSEPDKGTWKIVQEGEKRTLFLNLPEHKEQNEIKTLTEKEFTFVNDGTAVTLTK